ncbi:hypothetical protein DV515_00015419 [Chloebia gouldiae]|uniref:Uncharacterized protein n=1 Tax=Chloebia gouldiae TaxID=44316 RepID=A0A3L8RV64_CHLGU|nr:hypothetical protein DV515_00015419 [Chloebia gouldiae]
MRAEPKRTQRNQAEGSETEPSRAKRHRTALHRLEPHRALPVPRGAGPVSSRPAPDVRPRTPRPAGRGPGIPEQLPHPRAAPAPPGSSRTPEQLSQPRRLPHTPKRRGARPAPGPSVTFSTTVRCPTLLPCCTGAWRGLGSSYPSGLLLLLWAPRLTERTTARAALGEVTREMHTRYGTQHPGPGTGEGNRSYFLPLQRSVTTSQPRLTPAPHGTRVTASWPWLYRGTAFHHLQHP